MLSRFARSLFAATCAAALSFTFALAPAVSATPDKAAQDAKKPGDTKAKKDAKKDDAKSDKKGADKAKKDDAKDTKKSAADKAKKDDAKADKKLADKADKDAKKSAKKDDKDAKDAVDVKGTASIGAPNKGRLQGGIKLKSSRSLKVREHAHSWGLPALVKLLQRAAGKVAKHHPKSVMLVGDLSQKSGGSLTGHNSHQTGRDADVGFYVANSMGKPAAMNRFVAFDGSGKSQAVTWAQFDDARNWALVEALLTDKDTTVRYIFVSMPLRARVLAFAKKEKVAKDLYTRAETVLMSPRDADVHDDHFHVRIACPEGMKGFCVEESSARGGSAVAASTKSNAKPANAANAAANTANDDAKGDDAKSDEPKAAPVADAKPAQ